jgi:hypothetical protein
MAFAFERPPVAPFRTARYERTGCLENDATGQRIFVASRGARICIDSVGLRNDMRQGERR